MISRVVLGDGTILDNVDEIQEVVQNNGNFILNGLTINLVKRDDVALDLSVIESIFSREDVLSNIKAYAQDIINYELNESGQEIPIYGDEYISLDTSVYTGVQSIYKHISNGRISVQLTADPTKISDDKYNELLMENNSFKNQNEILTQSIAELTAIVSMLMV